MAEPKRISVKLSFDGGSPVRIHTDLSMFAQAAKKKTPDTEKIERIRTVSSNFQVTKGMLLRFVED